MKKFWNNILIKLGIRKPEPEELDEDHARDMIMNRILYELSDEELKELMGEDSE